MEWIIEVTGKPDNETKQFMSNRLVSNSLTGTALFIINILIMFIMSPVIVKALGNRDYGLWEMVMGVVGYMGLLDIGIGAALLRYVAVSHAQKDRQELQNIISTAQVFFLAIGLIAVTALLLLSRFPNLLVGRESVDTNYLGMVLILFAVNAGLSLPSNVFTVILMGVQRHYLINITRGLLGVIRAFIAYYLLLKFAGKGLLVLATLEPVFTIIHFSIFAVALRRDPSIPPFSISACSLSKMKELFRYGSKSALLMVASRLQSASLPFVISSVIGVSSIVYFTMPNRLIDYAKGLSLSMGFPLTPYFASQMTGNDKEAVRTSWLQTSLALQIVTTAMPLFILFCGEQFLSIWIGKEYGIAGRGVLYCLVTALFVEAIAPNASRILMASGHHGRAAIMWLVLAIASIPLAVLGASYWGVTGVALGSSTALIFGSIITLYMACNDVGVTFWGYFQRTLMRLVVPLLLLTFLLWVSGKILSPVNYLDLALQVIPCAIIYILAVWFITLSSENRSRIMNQISAHINKIIS